MYKKLCPKTKILCITDLNIVCYPKGFQIKVNHSVLSQNRIKEDRDLNPVLNVSGNQKFSLFEELFYNQLP